MGEQIGFRNMQEKLEKLLHILFLKKEITAFGNLIVLKYFFIRCMDNLLPSPIFLVFLTSMKARSNILSGMPLPILSLASLLMLFQRNCRVFILCDFLLKYDLIEKRYSHLLCTLVLQMSLKYLYGFVFYRVPTYFSLLSNPFLFKHDYI